MGLCLLECCMTKEEEETSFGVILNRNIPERKLTKAKTKTLKIHQE